MRYCRLTLLALLALLFLLLLLFLGGCAASTYTPGDCDPENETCTCGGPGECPSGWTCSDEGTCVRVAGQDAGVDLVAPDGALVPDLLQPDTFIGKAFGEACTDKAECASGICLFAGTGGICTKLCTAGSCPKGYGCLGVIDVIEQGSVTEVCVPNFDQLCTPCTEDKECSLSGADLCLDLPFDGQLYCARDCAQVACPNGYTCTEVTTTGGSKSKQCLPDSGSCECDASKSGTTKACSITTPFGTCQGTRTCQGSTGWGSCEPPSATDVPDGLFVDDNCDGIDGDITAGIFVATSGSDVNTCGMHASPCKTINFALGLAETGQLKYVYVQAGQYDEVIVLKNGVNIYGGFDTNWKRDARTKPAHKVVVNGDLDKDEDQYITVRAHSLAQPTILGDLVLVGPDAQGATLGGSRSSHVVHADTVSSLTLERVTLQAGNGADGAAGQDGADAPVVTPTSIMDGGIGGNGEEEFDTCDETTRGSSGGAGINSCPGSPSPLAGKGGRGGTKDTCCDCVFSVCTCLTCSCSATNGENGDSADQFLTGGYGYRGAGGAGGGTCAPGINGNDGRVQNGSGGTKGSKGLMTGGYWYAKAGGAAGTGEHGGGGGGAGGSGGCDTGTDSSGAGGGGGGAGGCAALTGGSGGGGGGGSFGVLAEASTITITDCEIQLGNGGAGGDGGTGGRGQSGGKGGLGGIGGSGTSDGGDGGAGGHGGHGGGGGGAAGGVAYGIFSYKSNITQSCTFSGGSAGNGGKGGASAPAAPVAERDGNPGQDGDDAPAPADVGTCSDQSDCW